MKIMKMNVLKKVMLLALIAITFSFQKTNETKVFTEKDITVIPKPAELKLQKGNFTFTKNTQFVATDVAQKEIVSILTDKFKLTSGWDLQIVKKAPKKDFVQFIVDNKLADEAYKLEVNSNRVIIYA